MSKIRIRMTELEKMDERFDTSMIREIEMTVDAIVTRINPIYGIQFWRDVQLYGIKEALMYLDNFIAKENKPTRFIAERNELGRMLTEAEDRWNQYARLVVS